MNVADVKLYPEVEDFYHSFVARSAPVVLREYAAEWPALRRWDREYFARVHTDARVQVHSLQQVFRANLCDGNVTSVTEVPLGAHVGRLMDSEDNDAGYSFQVSLLWEAPELLSDILVPRYVKLRDLLEINLWVGTRNNRAGMHFDTKHNLFAQVIGRKSFILAPFNRWEARLHDAMSANYRMVDADVRTPSSKFESSEYSEVVLGPGDLLFLPAFWLHDVVALDTSVSVNCFWKADVKDCPARGLIRILEHPDSLAAPQRALANFNFASDALREIISIQSPSLAEKYAL